MPVVTRHLNSSYLSWRFWRSCLHALSSGALQAAALSLSMVGRCSAFRRLSLDEGLPSIAVSGQEKGAWEAPFSSVF
jgi:hypothetical protein